ncbi:hypothetical protein DVH05_023871 [Phytophthora capsici]|nr:hypothetical protein DVH05_023871 [Phytophthora capsici]
MAARPGAMPHRPVSAPKEMPPVVDRLRLALIHTMRRTIIEAVDKVWSTFEDELAQLTLPSIESSVDDFEKFSNYCSRLTRFIDNNMETTPEFLTQMDRLILACHSGATGPALNSVMTKELRIRRGGKQKDGKQHVTTSGGIREPRVISPPSDTTEQEKSSDSEIEMTGTVGTPSRQWTTRKRLSTRMVRQPRTKRVKRSLMAHDGELLRQEEAKGVDGGAQPKENAKKVGNKLSTPTLVKQFNASERNCRQRTSGSQPRSAYGAEQKKTRARRSERAAKHGESRKTETARKLRWDLRSTSNGSSKDYQTRSKSKQEKEFVKLEESISMSKYKCLAMTCEEVSREEDTTKDGDKGDPRIDESAQQLNSSAAANVGIEAGGSVDVAALEREIDSALASRGVYLVEEIVEDSIENTKTLRNPKAIILDERDDLDCISPAENNEMNCLSSKTSTRELSRGVIGHEVQVTLDDNSVDCAAKKNDNDREDLHSSTCNAGIDTCRANAAHDIDNSTESQQPEPTFFDSDILEVNFDESDEESAVPGLCDAGMRTASQISHFKACLRKSIRLVDAMLCQPPPGKKCSRGCDKIRARQCREGVPCRDPLCRNWHDAEAHTEHCTNDLCEFKNRIVLRETMNQIANLNEEIKSLMSQWEEHLMEYTVATVDSTSKQYTPTQLQQLHDDIEQLFRQLSSSKKEIESLESKQRLLRAYLSAIGITTQADAADNFPDFDTHYQ